MPGVISREYGSPMQISTYSEQAFTSGQLDEPGTSIDYGPSLETECIKSEPHESEIEIENTVLTKQEFHCDSVSSVDELTNLKVEPSDIKVEKRDVDTSCQSVKIKRFEKNTKKISLLLRNKSKAVKTIVKMQLYNKKPKKWSKTEMQISASIYSKAPKMYRFMINEWGFILPSNKTVNHWLLKMK